MLYNTSTAIFLHFETNDLLIDGLDLVLKCFSATPKLPQLAQNIRHTACCIVNYLFYSIIFYHCFLTYGISWILFHLFIHAIPLEKELELVSDTKQNVCLY